MTNNIPQLRFPEFVGEWEEKRLGEICVMTSSKRVYLSDYTEFGIPFYRGKEITELKEGKKPTDILYITEDSYNSFKDKYGVPVIGDILITAVGTLGNVLKIDNNEKFYFKDGNLIWLREVTENSNFLEKLIQLKTNELIKTSIGSTQKALTMVELRKLQFMFPFPAEQTRIATFLTAVDKRINLLEDKKKALEKYKKGVMQKVFDGNWVKVGGQLKFQPPTIRFKNEDSSDFPDWEEKKLGELYSFNKTNSFSRDKLNYVDGDVKNIHYGDIHTKFAAHFDIEKEYVPYINLDIDLSKIADDCFVQQGDLVVADASEDYADIGKAIEVIHLNNEKLVAGLHTFLARRKNKKMVVGFGGHLFKSFYLRLSIMRIAQGTKVLSISTTRLAEIKVQIPRHEEQQKIAEFLSSIDRSIEKMDRQINLSQEWKKGLLQKMFV